MTTKKFQEGALRLQSIGAALTPDFLKECGCLWASKPDTHALHVLDGLSGDKRGELPILGESGSVYLMIEAARSLRAEAEDDSITAYELDKLIWLASIGGLPR